MCSSAFPEHKCRRSALQRILSKKVLHNIIAGLRKGILVNNTKITVEGIFCQGIKQVVEKKEIEIEYLSRFSDALKGVAGS